MQDEATGNMAEGLTTGWNELSIPKMYLAWGQTIWAWIHTAWVTLSKLLSPSVAHLKNIDNRRAYPTAEQMHDDLGNGTWSI